MLEAVVPQSIGGSPAFDAFLHALVRPLTTYIEWAAELLTEEDPGAGGPLDGQGDGQGATLTETAQRGPNHDPSSATAILADSERLIAAVDAFVANPLADDVRSGLVLLLNEVLTPALASARRPPVMARPIAAAAVPVQLETSPPKLNQATDEPAKPDSTDPGSPNPISPNPDSPGPDQPHDALRNASDQDDAHVPLLPAHPPEVEQVTTRALPTHSQRRHAVEKQTDEGASAGRRVSEQPSTQSGVPPVRPDDSAQHWWQERFEQLNRRMNGGFLLIGAVGLGLLALNLYETFARPRPGVELVQAAARRTEPTPVVAPVVDAPAAIAGLDLASFEALARQLQASGEDITALLAQWSSGPGNSVQALETRMLAMETEFSRLRVDLDAMGASFQVDAEAYAMADTVDTVPTTDAGAVSEPIPFDEMESAARIRAGELTSADPDGGAGAESGMGLTVGAPGETDALPSALVDVEESMLEPMWTDDPDPVRDDGLAQIEPASLTLTVPAREVILTAPAYGIQLGAMRRETGARALAEKTAIASELLFVQASGSWHFVILGWFTDQDEARAALASLPRSVRRLHPLIRFVEAGSRVTPLDAL